MITQYAGVFILFGNSHPVKSRTRAHKISRVRRLIYTLPAQGTRIREIEREWVREKEQDNEKEKETAKLSSRYAYTRR